MNLPMDLMSRSRAWSRALGWLGLAGALAILARWMWNLAHVTPHISRSDHLLAMWRIAPAIERGDWGAVAAWVLEFSGGHIIGFARLLQLVNYLAFDYSGAFIAAAAVLSFAALWGAIAFAVLRTMRLDLASGLVLVWAAWVVCNPVLSNLVTWPEGAPPFLLSTLVAALFVPWLGRGGAGSVAAGTAAAALTNGAGLMFLPAAVLARLRPRQLVIAAMAGALAVAGVALLVRLAGTRHVVSRTTELVPAMDLRIAVESLHRLASYPGLFAQYWLAELALPFSPFRIGDIWPIGLAIAAFTAVVLACTPHRTPGPQRGWLALAYFGLLSALALAIGRIGYIDPQQTAGAVITSHYASIAFPLPIALAPLTAMAVASARRPLRIALLVLAAALAGTLVWKRSIVEDDFRAVARNELAAQFGAGNWNIFSGALTLGDTSVGQIAVLRIFPELKALGKYPELTRDFVTDPASLGIATATRSTQGNCGRIYRLAPDERYVWFYELAKSNHLYTPGAAIPFSRTVGYTTCGAELLVMFGQDGKPQCVARPGPLATHYTEPELKALPGMGERSFDFSCPGGKAESVWAFDRGRKLLIPLETAR